MKAMIRLLQVYKLRSYRIRINFTFWFAYFSLIPDL